jgi:hypothetical protein
VAGIYVATSVHGLRQRLEAKHSRLLQDETDCGFDPAGREDDYGILKHLLP